MLQAGASTGETSSNYHGNGLNHTRPTDADLESFVKERKMYRLRWGRTVIGIAAFLSVAAAAAQPRSAELPGVLWHMLGMHHFVRAEDWPVMPVLWHSFELRPFDFFDRNPALDLPQK